MENESPNSDVSIIQATDEHWRETTRIEAPKQSLAVFSATALRQNDLRTRFNVRLDQFQERTGFKFKEESTYEIIGTIDGVADFRKMYSPGVTREMAIFAPREYADAIRDGDKYTLHVNNVREISRNADQLGVFSATAYKVPGRGNIRFDLLISSFEKRTGVKFDEERIYLIKGTISNICDFHVTHTGGKGEHLFVFAPREAADKLKVGEKYDLTFLSAEEKRTFQVPYGKSLTRLTLQTRVLRGAGLDVDVVKKSEDRIVELEMRNHSQPDKGLHRYYTILEPTRGVAVLNIGRGGGKQGDIYELLRAKQPTIEEFVRDFNTFKGKELQNVILVSEGKKLWMDVDGQRFDLKNESLKVQNLQVFLSVEMEPFKRDLRFWFDGETITPKFGQSWRIRSFAATESRVKMVFSMGKRTIRTDTDSKAEGPRLSVEQIREKIVHVRADNDGLLFEANSSLHEFVYSRFTDTLNRNMGRYIREKGRISEDICVATLSETNWEEIHRHPSASGSKDDHGPDSIMRNKETGELFLFEFKWWDNPEKARQDAISQVEDYFFQNPTYRGEEIKGAYIGILDWKLKSAVGRLEVRRIC